MKSLTQITKSWHNNALSRRFGRYSFKQNRNRNSQKLTGSRLSLRPCIVDYRVPAEYCISFHALWPISWNKLNYVQVNTQNYTLAEFQTRHSVLKWVLCGYFFSRLLHILSRSLSNFLEKIKLCTGRY